MKKITDWIEQSKLYSFESKSSDDTDGIVKFFYDAKEIIPYLLEQNEKLKNLLNIARDYFEHDLNICAMAHDFSKRCNCGLEDLKNKIKELEGEHE